MVSTDSEEIAEVARSYGAKVPFLRSEKTSNDFATTADVLEEVLNTYKTEGKDFDSFACIYPTAPFITGERLAEAAGILDDNNNAVISVVRYSFPPQRAFILRDGKLSYQYPQYEKARSQDLEPVYHDCGQFYIEKTEPFLKEFTLVTSKTIPYVLPEEEVQDIDTYSDWQIAEMKYELLRNSGNV